MALGFFRRNTKFVIWIMVVLMVVFVLSSVPPDYWQGLFSPEMRDPVVGVVDGEEIAESDLGNAWRSLMILRRLGLGNAEAMLKRMVTGEAGAIPGETGFLMLQAQPIMVNGQIGHLRPTGEHEQALMWTLLVREAEGMGLQAEGVAVDQFIFDAIGLDEASFASWLVAMQTEGVSEKRVRQAIGEFLIVSMAFESVAAGLTVPEPRLRELYKQLDEQLDLAMLQLRAEAFLDEVPGDPMAEGFADEIDAMFMAGRNYLRNGPRNPNPMGFGYRRPARVRLEYAFIRMNEVLARITVTEEQIYDYWTAHREEFMMPPDPAEPDAEPTVPTFAEVKNDVRQRVRRIEAEERIQTIVADLLGTATLEDEEPTEASPLEQAAEAMADVGVRYVAPPEPMSREDILADPVLGAASMVAGQQQYRLADLAMAVPPLLPEEARDRAVVDIGTVFRHPMEIRGPNPGVVIWRVVDALPSVVPTAMDENVRRQVVADWRTRQAFGIAEQKAEEARTRIGEVGMAAVAADLGREIHEAESITRATLISGFQGDRMAEVALQILGLWAQMGAEGDLPMELPPEALFRVLLSRPSIKAVPRVEAVEPAMDEAATRRFLETVFEMADVAPGEDIPATAPAPAEAVRVAAVPSIASVIVAQRVRAIPAYEEDYRESRPVLLDRQTADRRTELMHKWFSTAEIRSRNAFVETVREQQHAPPEEAGIPVE